MTHLAARPSSHWPCSIGLTQKGPDHLGKPNADPHKAVPIPRCLRAASNTLCQCVWAGLLVSDGVYPGHFLGKFHMAPSERKVRTGPVPFINRRHQRREVAAAGWPRQVKPPQFSRSRPLGSGP